MQIETVNIYKVHLPFKGDFSISKKKGLSSIVVVVEIISDHGRIRGYGEGIPDERVTGETPESAIENATRFIKSHLFPWTVTAPEQIWQLVDALPRGKEYDASLSEIVCWSFTVHACRFPGRCIIGPKRQSGHLDKPF